MYQASVGFHCLECVAGRGHRTAVVGSWKISGHKADIRKLGGTKCWITKILVFSNLAVFLVSIFLSRSFSLASTLLIEGGLIAKAYNPGSGLIGVGYGDYYRVLTSAFLHDGLWHIGFNVYAIFIVGNVLEKELKPARFSVLYVLSVLGGAFGALLLTPGSMTVGASGAIFGLFGALAVDKKARTGSFWRSPIGFVLIINLLFTLLIPNISVGGHLGGLIAGAAYGAMMLFYENRKVPRWVASTVGILWIVLLAVGCILVASHLA